MEPKTDYFLERKGAATGRVNEDDDLFDIRIEDASKPDRSKGAKGGSKPNPKRQKRDEKFGFGGKKRFSKSGTAASSADLSGFSAKRMKSQKKGTKRLGKSRRAKA